MGKKKEKKRKLKINFDFCVSKLHDENGIRGIKQDLENYIRCSQIPVNYAVKLRKCIKYLEQNRPPYSEDIINIRNDGAYLRKSDRTKELGAKIY